MKQTIKTGLAALVLLLAISCKKENSSIQFSGIYGSSSAQNVITEDKVLAGKTVRIGTQKWTVGNLRTKFYRNGDPIPQVTDPIAWMELTTGAWCWYNNDSATYAQTYGKLYNWYAVNDPRGLAPAGYHIPSDVEWDTLTTFLGGYTKAGGKMKETGTTHWLAPNTGATNRSGFTALPGGERLGGPGGPGFSARGIAGCFWCSTESVTNFSNRVLRSWDGLIVSGIAVKQDGLSVRCLKD